MTDFASIIQHYPEMNGVHPAADLFPMMDAVEFAELCKAFQKADLSNPSRLTRMDCCWMAVIAFLPATGTAGSFV